ncbi:condensation domain-containing protein, partial [Dietzia cercidiphylli]|uniref:condensation domain-containing protein n=1 Tax=Dietzia cercidiphylli TaxID=498199 RepID=UPI003F7E6EA5
MGSVELVAVQRPEAVPLSFAQARMWFLNQFGDSPAVYNIPGMLQLSGRLDVAVLRDAVGDVVERHESLRTVIGESVQGPVQVVLPTGQARQLLELEVVQERTRGDVIEAAEAFAAAGFDLTAELPMRVRVYSMSETEHVAVFVLHHIAADGWSFAPLARDFVAAYDARMSGIAPSWPSLPVQYADYAIWQRNRLGDENDPESLAAVQLGFWRDRLAGIPDQVDLPSDRVRPA